MLILKKIDEVHHLKSSEKSRLGFHNALLVYKHVFQCELRSDRHHWQLIRSCTRSVTAQFQTCKKILFGTEFQLISCRSPVPLYVCCVICRLVFYPKAALVPCSNIAPIVLLIRKTIIYVTPEMIPIQWPWSQTFEIGLTACQELRALCVAGLVSI
jgi:hypothetical protein